MKCFFFSIFLVLIILIQSCKAQCDTEYLESFKKELTEEAFNKYTKNEPISFCEKIGSSVQFQAYFEEFGNSSISVLYDVSKTPNILDKYEGLISLNPEEIKYQDSIYAYEYHDLKTKEKLVIPEINQDLSDYCDVKSLINKKAKIFITDKGSLEKVFLKNQFVKKVNFVSGIYYLADESKIVYWLIFYV